MQIGITIEEKRNPDSGYSSPSSCSDPWPMLPIHV